MNFQVGKASRAQALVKKARGIGHSSHPVLSRKGNETSNRSEL